MLCKVLCLLWCVVSIATGWYSFWPSSFESWTLSLTVPSLWGDIQSFSCLDEISISSRRKYVRPQLSSKTHFASIMPYSLYVYKKIKKNLKKALKDKRQSTDKIGWLVSIWPVGFFAIQKVCSLFFSLCKLMNTNHTHLIVNYVEMIIQDAFQLNRGGLGLPCAARGVLWLCRLVAFLDFGSVWSPFV